MGVRLGVQNILYRRTIIIKISLTILLFITTLWATSIEDYIDLNKCDKIIDKRVIKICYSYKYKGAFAVWYELDGSLVNKINIKKRPRFYSEKNIPIKYRSKYKDYTHSGFDRGHLANDAGFDYNKKVLSKVYTMANIVPQYPNVNRHQWVKAEKYERKVAYNLGSVNVINIVEYSSNPKRIGANKIAVPSSFTKIIYNDRKKFKKAFNYDNKPDKIKGDKLKDHILTK
jgi:endonuclease G